MRLLFVSPVGFVGGAERVLLECVRQVRRRKPDWPVAVLLLDDGPLVQAVDDLGAEARLVAMPSYLSHSGDSKLIEAGTPSENGRKQLLPARLRSLLGLPMRLAGMTNYYYRVRKAVREFQPDLIHSNGLKSHLITAATQSRSARTLWHIHDYYSHRPRIQAWIRRLSSRAFAGVAISQSVADDIATVLPDKPVFVLENCVDTERFTPGPSEARDMDRSARLDPEFDGLRVGLIATYANWKGQDVFLKALAEVPNVRGYVIGGPIYRTAGSQWSESELQSLVKKLEIDDRVGFVPFQSDPTWLYRSLDIVVHASKRPEPFGLTIVEAMACGRPVIVSDAGGAHDLFVEGETGLGHIPNDSTSLARAMTKLVGDSELRLRLGRAARKAAEERFSTDLFGAKLIEIYESAIP